MADLDEIAGRVAVNVHRPDDDPTVAAAVNAAAVYVETYTGLADADPPGTLPDDALTSAGLVVFATRIYVDQYAPNGVVAAVGDTSVDPLFTPEDLYRHVHHYFDRLAVSWGVA